MGVGWTEDLLCYYGQQKFCMLVVKNETSKKGSITDAYHFFVVIPINYDIIYSFNKCLLMAHYVPSSVIEVSGTSVNKTEKKISS